MEHPPQYNYIILLLQLEEYNLRQDVSVQPRFQIQGEGGSLSLTHTVAEGASGL